jgi:hypothetical protein
MDQHTYTYAVRQERTHRVPGVLNANRSSCSVSALLVQQFLESHHGLLRVELDENLIGILPIH